MMTPASRVFATVAFSCLFGLATQGTAQTTGAGDAPLSVIDWLGKQPRIVPKAPKVVVKEPPVAKTGTVPQVSVAPLSEGSPRAIGLVPPSVTGLPVDLWSGSSADDAIHALNRLPDLTLPAARALLYTVLLAEAYGPQDGPDARAALTLARVQKLMDLGALDPAMSLIEQAGVTTSPAHFDLWMQISLLTGTEDRACRTLLRVPYLTEDYAVRIFCAARDGQWDTAALTFGSAQALSLMPKDRLALLDRFLNPDFFEGEPPLTAPRKMDPLSFRMFEAIGEPKSTRNLPRAYAVADLRDVAGWKAQLEAAERLTRVGALPDNKLLGIYTDREPAASGGIWDRVEALQRFDTALGTGSSEAVAKTLPAVWTAMQEAELETAFATLFADPLAEFELTGRAARVAFEVGLLSPSYEATAARAPQDPDSAVLAAIARGEPPRPPGDAPIVTAIAEAFADALPLEDYIADAGKRKLGVTILRVIALLNQGAGGDTIALRDALATLRALGLEDTARRASLQVLLLTRAN
jgi:hypothetical protein